VVAKKKITSGGHPWLVRNLGSTTRYAYMLPDSPHSRCADPDFWGGHNQSDTYPSIVALRRSANPSATQWPRQRLSKDWMIFVREINAAGDPDQQIDPWKIENMAADEMPKPEFITTSGNLHVVIEQTHNAIRLQSFGLAAIPPDPAEFNFANAAAHVVHMMATHKDDFFALISSGSGHARDVYFPLMCPGSAWVHKSDDYCPHRYEILPTLPLTVTITARDGLSIREMPNEKAPSLGAIANGKTANVLRYYPDFTTGGIWGEISGGYIALQSVPHRGWSSAYYHTTFRLDAIPALRPV